MMDTRYNITDNEPATFFDLHLLLVETVETHLQYHTTRKPLDMISIMNQQIIVCGGLPDQQTN